MNAAEVSRQSVRLLVVDPSTGGVATSTFAELPGFVRPGDVIVVNDAATLPGSLTGTTSDGAPVEARLAGPIEGRCVTLVLLGAGDFRTRTEDRPAPPAVGPGARLRFADRSGRLSLEALEARVSSISPISPRLVEVEFQVASNDALWAALYAIGRPIQYAYRPEPLPLWSVQTAFAARPWAAEMPSAGRPLTWSILLELRRRGVRVEWLTHAAGLSATGDPALDAVLPLPERYQIPERTANAVTAARRRGERVIAVGTTVMRALESASNPDGTVHAGPGTATLVIAPGYQPRTVDGLVSGIHVPGESHYRLLGALASDETLSRATVLAEREGFHSHELGDACLVLPGALGRCAAIGQAA